MRRLFWCGLMLAGIWRCGIAQGAAAPSITDLLPKIFDYAERYRATLPSLSCDEMITSQEVRKGAVKKEVRVESTLREVRKGSGTNEFEEKHQFRTVNGAPYTGSFKIPYFVQGGFANAIGFAERSKMKCYDYKVFAGDDGSVLRLEMTGRPDLNGCSTIPEGYRKTAVVDRATGRVQHVERTISSGAAKKMEETYFASMDYGLQTIGDEALWLPVRMTSHDDKDEGRMTVVFTNYHRYLGSATIVPGAGEGSGPVDVRRTSGRQYR